MTKKLSAIQCRFHPSAQAARWTEKAKLQAEHEQYQKLLTAPILTLEQIAFAKSQGKKLIRMTLEGYFIALIGLKDYGIHVIFPDVNSTSIRIVNVAACLPLLTCHRVIPIGDCSERANHLAEEVREQDRIVSAGLEAALIAAEVLPAIPSCGSARRL